MMSGSKLFPVCLSFFFPYYCVTLYFEVTWGESFLPNILSGSFHCNIFNLFGCILNYYKYFESNNTDVVLLFYSPWDMVFAHEIFMTRDKLCTGRHELRAWRCPWYWNEPMPLSKKPRQQELSIVLKEGKYSSPSIILVWICICINKRAWISEGWRYVRTRQGPDRLSQRW